eukprot:GGOE01023281.1.p6 GENE.GGOE01023281.1~~GGOE01023281.1.p6  ORF type:complete len:104 (-),score=27.75 GGOE01023281.1:310-621(-)
MSSLDLARLRNASRDEDSAIATQALLHLHLAMQSIRSRRATGSVDPSLAQATDAALQAANETLRRTNLLNPAAQTNNNIHVEVAQLTKALMHAELALQAEAQA